MRTSPWTYFGLAFGLTWVFWIPAARFRGESGSLSVMALIALGGLAGPPLSALLLTYLSGGAAGLREFGHRLVDLRRIRPAWWGAIALLAPTTSLLGMLSARLTTGAWPVLSRPGELLASPVALLAFLVTTLLFGPLPEELGWRGYVQDRLQARWTPLTASLVLGLLWALWHLPLFFIRGTYHHQLGLGSLQSGLFFVGVVCASILTGWIYNGTNRSILAAVLVHFMDNLTGEFLDLPGQPGLYRSLWMIVITLLVSLAWRAALTRGARHASRTM